MKINKDVLLAHKRLILIPYLKEHVETYHNWMKSEENLECFLEATASEPLTLEEEYEMQESWAKDEDKLTFILFAPKDKREDGALLGKIIGDVNIFLNDIDDKLCGEIEIMVAEKDFRSQGLAKLAVKMMFNYAKEKLGLTKFICKIGAKNEISLKMFKGLGFEQIGFSEVFQEVTLQLKINEMESVMKVLREEVVEKDLKTTKLVYT